MDKCDLLKRFNRDLLLQVSMYTFVYVNPETMPVEEYFLSTKNLLITTIKCQPQNRYHNIGLELVTYVQEIMS